MIKVGDKIRILKDNANHAIVLRGEEGEVTKFLTRGYFSCKMNSSNSTWAFAIVNYGIDFEIIGSQNSPIARASTIVSLTGNTYVVNNGQPIHIEMIGDGGGGGIDKGFEIKLKKCECGKEKHGFARHSQWCNIKD